MPYIPEEEIERLKRETDLAGLIRADGVVLKPQGHNLVGLCPFHSDTTASLSVDPQKNLWHCFGCEAGGSAIDWIMKSRQVGFQYAVEILRERNGGVVIGSGRQGKPRLSSPLETSADDRQLLDQVFTYYHETLKKTPEALAYLAGRGIGKAELIEEFRI
ncbi:MAG: CHC2 zinc finger domain-containing protein, partial [Spirochaetota bacterium]